MSFYRELISLAQRSGRLSSIIQNGSLHYWPQLVVMLLEHLTVLFKPNLFFKANPSMDVPGIKDLLSVSAFSGSYSIHNGESSCHRYLAPIFVCIICTVIEWLLLITLKFCKTDRWTLPKCLNSARKSGLSNLKSLLCPPHWMTLNTYPLIGQPRLYVLDSYLVFTI